MATNSILLGVLLVLASALCGVGIWAALEAAKAARSTRVLAEDLDARLVPLLEKTDVAVDALNAELLRVDRIISRIEEVTERVESTSRTVQGVANAPTEIVTDIADRVRRAWRRRQAESAAERGEAADAPEPPEWPETGAAANPASPVESADTNESPEREDTHGSESTPGPEADAATPV